MNIIKADEGKIFRRIADGQIYGKEISLGYSYYINGIKLDTPHLDELSDFEQQNIIWIEHRIAWNSFGV